MQNGELYQTAEFVTVNRYHHYAFETPYSIFNIQYSLFDENILVSA